MSVSVHLNGIFYLSSKEAGRLSGYTSDYVSRLAREEKIVATRVGTQWFVEPKSLDAFLQFAEKAREERKNILRKERLLERQKSNENFSTQPLVSTTSTPPLASSVHISKDFDLKKSSAHRTALLAVASGVALACLFVLLPATPRSTLSAASMTSSLSGIVETMNRFSFAPLRSFFSLTSEDTESEILSAPVRTESTAQGIVVMPLSTSSSTVAALKDSFSDTVDVALGSDGVSGTITPIFTDGEGDAFRFVMVPVRSP